MDGYGFMGLVLGLSAGLSPGPLLTLLLAESLARGRAAGIRVALAPLVSDLPIVLLSLLVLGKLADFNPVLGVISLVGAAIVFRMGLDGMKTAGTVSGDARNVSNPLAKGVLVNLVSPHPYLFWLTVGAPVTVRAQNTSFGAAAGFIAGFYLALVGSKIGLALVAARTRKMVQGRIYVRVMKILGLVLCLLAAALLWEGIGLLGVI